MLKAVSFELLLICLLLLTCVCATTDNDFEDGCDDLEDEIVWENKDPDNLNSADDVIMINGRVIYYR